MTAEDTQSLDRPLAELLDAQPVYVDGVVRIMAERCSSCPFRPGDHQALIPKGTVRWMTEGIRSHDSVVVCHKSCGTGQPGVVCAGGDGVYESSLMREARDLGIVVVLTEAQVLAEARRYRARRAEGTPR